jgi:hypothetical protein
MTIKFLFWEDFTSAKFDYLKLQENSTIMINPKPYNYFDPGTAAAIKKAGDAVSSAMTKAFIVNTVINIFL